MRGKTFPQASVVKILQNEQYTGCLLLQQSYNYRPKKQKLNYGEMPMYRVDGHHDPIITEETFRKAMEMKERRSRAAERDPQYSSAFSGLVWCGKCGRRASWHRSPQARKRGDMSSMIWICNGKNSQKGCDCRNIQDRDIRTAAEGLGIETEKIDRIEMYDDRLKFHLRNGRAETWRRT